MHFNSILILWESSQFNWFGMQQGSLLPLIAKPCNSNLHFENVKTE